MPQPKLRETPLSASMTGREAFEAVHRRLTPILYAMKAGPFGDRDHERRVRAELDAVLEELETVLDQP
jgi:hypothetical protein